MTTVIDITGKAEVQNWLKIGRLSETKGKTPAQIKKDQAEIARLMEDEDDEGYVTMGMEEFQEFMKGSAG